jgi:hypothetical protein
MMDLLFLSAWLFSFAPAPAPAPAPDEQAVVDLLRRGDQLAREKRYAEALMKWTDAYVEKLPLYRDLRFIYPVEARLMPRAALRSKLLAVIGEEYPEEKIRADVVSYSLLGFFPGDFDLRSCYVSLLTEEIGGFYDPDTKELYLILEEPAPPKWWQKLLSSDSTLDADEQKATLAHEMSHALVDQHFDLFSLQRSVEDDDDESLAVTALVEGEAMLSMMVDMAGPSGRDLLSAGSGFLSGYLKLVLPLAASFLGGPTFRKAPLLIRETLLFPYTEGMALCMSLTRGGRWDRVDRAFRDPPVSTEQALHPEKYGVDGKDRDDPVAIAFADPAPLEAGDWELVKENTLGELQTEILLRDKLGRGASAAAAAGWDGDTYRVYRRKAGDGKTLLVWVSTWDSEGEAAEFVRAARKIFPAESGGASPAGLRLTASGADVVIVYGIEDEGLASAVLAWASRCARSPKRIQLRRFDPKAPFVEDPAQVRRF